MITLLLRDHGIVKMMRTYYWIFSRHSRYPVNGYCTHNKSVTGSSRTTVEVNYINIRYCRSIDRAQYYKKNNVFQHSPADLVSTSNTCNISFIRLKSYHTRNNMHWHLYSGATAQNVTQTNAYINTVLV